LRNPEFVSKARPHLIVHARTEQSLEALLPLLERAVAIERR